MTNSIPADETPPADAAILQRRLAELEQENAGLRRDLAVFQLVIDSLPMRVFWKEAKDLCYLGCSVGFARDVGRTSSADFIGRDDYVFSPAPLAEAYRADDFQVMQTRQARVNFEEPQSRPDGGEAWLLTSKIPLVDADNTLIGVLGTYEDITERRIAERVRLDAQEQLINAQQDSLRELSTPLIPLADGVLVMPLVGTIDGRRAQQIMETLLEGIGTNQAEVAILDITGVRVVDTHVANALIRAAQAAKLLGAHVVLTGISVEVAQTIVHLGADLTLLVTRSNLQHGIAYALERK
jgi:rsbT co-antagonist protein RsbR